MQDSFDWTQLPDHDKPLDIASRSPHSARTAGSTVVPRWSDARPGVDVPPHLRRKLNARPLSARNAPTRPITLSYGDDGVARRADHTVPAQYLNEAYATASVSPERPKSARTLVTTSRDMLTSGRKAVPPGWRMAPTSPWAAGFYSAVNTSPYYVHTGPVLDEEAPMLASHYRCETRRTSAEVLRGEIDKVVNEAGARRASIESEANGSQAGGRRQSREGPRGRARRASVEQHVQEMEATIASTQEAIALVQKQRDFAEEAQQVAEDAQRVTKEEAEREVASAHEQANLLAKAQMAMADETARLEVSRAEAEAHAARTEAKEAKEALRRVERETEAEVQLLQAETAVAKDRVKGLEKELERMARQRQQTDRLLDQAKHQRICDEAEMKELNRLLTVSEESLLEALGGREAAEAELATRMEKTNIEALVARNEALEASSVASIESIAAMKTHHDDSLRSHSENVAALVKQTEAELADALKQLQVQGQMLFERERLLQELQPEVDELRTALGESTASHAAEVRELRALLPRHVLEAKGTALARARQAEWAEAGQELEPLATNRSDASSRAVTASPASAQAAARKSRPDRLRSKEVDDLDRELQTGRQVRNGLEMNLGKDADMIATPSSTPSSTPTTRPSTTEYTEPVEAATPASVEVAAPASVEAATPTPAFVDVAATTPVQAEIMAAAIVTAILSPERLRSEGLVQEAPAEEPEVVPELESRPERWVSVGLEEGMAAVTPRRYESRTGRESTAAVDSFNRRTEARKRWARATAAVLVMARNE